MSAVANITMYDEGVLDARRRGDTDRAGAHSGIFARVGSKKTHATSQAVTTAFVKRNKTHVTCHAVTTAFVGYL